MKTVRTEEDLAEAIDQKEDTIVVEGDLANKVIKIKATGTAAWFVAAGLIIVAVGAIIASGKTSVAEDVPKAMSLVDEDLPDMLGADVATAAICLAVTAGGVGILNQLRSYSIIEEQDDRVVLQR